MYSRVVVNRLSTAWPARWMLLASWCQLLRVQWGHFICVRSASQSSDDFFFQFHLIIWFIKFLHDFCFSPKETKNKINTVFPSIKSADIRKSSNFKSPKPWIMFLFYVLNFFKSEDIIQGGTLFKGGHWLRKYGKYILSIHTYFLR